MALLVAQPASEPTMPFFLCKSKWQLKEHRSHTAFSSLVALEELRRSFDRDAQPGHVVHHLMLYGGSFMHAAY